MRRGSPIFTGDHLIPPRTSAIFYIEDPSRNFLECKYCFNAHAIFGEQIVHHIGDTHERKGYPPVLSLSSTYPSHDNMIMQELEGLL